MHPFFRAVGLGPAGEMSTSPAGPNPALRSEVDAQTELHLPRRVRLSRDRRLLEDGLERPIIDETGLDGTYDLEVHGDARSNEECLDILRDQLGLVLTPEHRNIEMLVIRLLQ